MSLIHFEWNGDDSFTVFCPGCHSEVGVARMPEIAEWSKAGIVPYCFDCEPGGVDEWPDALYDPDGVFLLAFEDVLFLAEWSPAPRVGVRGLILNKLSSTVFIDRLTGRVSGIDPSLVCYTYLNDDEGGRGSESDR